MAFEHSIISIPESQKQCHKCFEWKLLSEFYKDRKQSDDLSYYCKECARKAKRIYYENNKELIRTAVTIYANKNKEKIKRRNKKKRLENLEKIREKDRLRQAIGYAENPEKYLERTRKYVKKYPEKKIQKEALRRARKLHSPNSVPINPIVIAERDRWTCHICHKRVTRKNWSLDHLNPLSKGGSHTPENVALAHRRCNSKRGAGRIPAQLRLLG